MSALDPIEAFISRWENSGAAERANYQMFISELCDVLGVARPDPTSPDPDKNLYVLDRAITRTNPDGSSVTNYIDCYKARHFVLETKQADLPGTETSSLETENLKLETPATPPAWPARLPDQVTLIRHLLTTDPTTTADQLSARFGRKNKKRTEQIEGILETLKGLGRV